MQEFLGISIEELERRGAYNTAKEIVMQPEVWEKTFEVLKKHSNKISQFLEEVYSNEKLNIILTGAGTSAFIGEVLQGPFQSSTGITTRAVPTTSLVTHPEFYVHKDKPTLLVSFARSGNSPESVHAIKVVEGISSRLSHIIITCNENGELTKIADTLNSYVIVLPPETNDKSLAMTSSFTSMLLCGILVSKITQINELENSVRLLSKYGKKIVEEYFNDLKNSASLDFDRAVFLGSGLFEGIARESHLKLQELTDGKIVCKFDTFLGFRHGPKAVINDKTLIVYIHSNNKYVMQYDIDLIQSVMQDNCGLCTISIMEKDIPNIDVTKKIVLSDSEELISEDFLAIVSVLPAQILAFYKSLNLNLQPDNPSISGAISRVVKGVKTYEYLYNQ